MTALGLGRVKTKSDLVVMPSGRQIFAFFCSRVRLYRVEFLHSLGQLQLLPQRNVDRRSSSMSRRTIAGRNCTASFCILLDDIILHDDIALGEADISF